MHVLIVEKLHGEKKRTYFLPISILRFRILRPTNEVRKGSDFDEIRKNQLCMNNLNSIERNLIDYCEIRERNIDAFKALNHMKII